MGLLIWVPWENHSRVRVSGCSLWVKRIPFLTERACIVGKKLSKAYILKCRWPVGIFFMRCRSHHIACILALNLNNAWCHFRRIVCYLRNKYLDNNFLDSNSWKMKEVEQGTTAQTCLYSALSTHYWAHSEYLKTPESEGANKACWCGTVKINIIQYFYKIYINRINSVIKVEYKASWESSKYSNSYSNLCMGLIMF